MECHHMVNTINMLESPFFHNKLKSLMDALPTSFIFFKTLQTQTFADREYLNIIKKREI